MKKNTYSSLILFLLFNLFSGYSVIAQTTYNANFAALSFLAANKVHKVGTTGIAAGDVTLYTNVITIGGQQVDCILRTASSTNATFTLPGAAAGGTIPFDYSSATGTGMSANQDKYFSPTFSFGTGGGSCKFHFDLIQGGSYNNTTNTGTQVILQNVYLNTYDIDGNGTAGTNQYNEFGGFAGTVISTGTNITATYNTVSGLTKFRSNSATNTADVSADANRIKIQYNYITQFDIVVGSDGPGAAYFFLDFSTGVTWTGTTTSASAPALDLSTTTAGLNNALSVCGVDGFFTNGSANLTLSSNSIDEVNLSFLSAEIPNGNSETIIPNGSTVPASDILTLGFTASANQTFILGAVTYQAQKTVAAGVRTIKFVKNGGGTLTTVQAETLIDALKYKNTAATATIGNRNFSVSIREGAFFSPTTVFTVNVTCASLPVKWLSFTTTTLKNQTIQLNWSTASEQNSKDFSVQHSNDGLNWNTFGTVAAAGNSSSISNYGYKHNNAVKGNNFYRILQSDSDGKSSYSETKTIYLSIAQEINIISSQVMNNVLQVQVHKTTQLALYNAEGKLLLKKLFTPGLQQISMSNYTKGIYYIMTNNTIEKIIVQ